VRARRWVRKVRKENSMLVDYVLGGIVTAGLLIYLTYVLLRPERF
jgi:K+-transporting ATPase KdpF subunit